MFALALTMFDIMFKNNGDNLNISSLQFAYIQGLSRTMDSTVTSRSKGLESPVTRILVVSGTLQGCIVLTSPSDLALVSKVIKVTHTHQCQTSVIY